MRRGRTRLLAVLLAGTLLMIGSDLASPAGDSWLRTAASVVFGPVLTALAPGAGPADLRAADRIEDAVHQIDADQRTRVEAEVRALVAATRAALDPADPVDSAGGVELRIVPARVVGIGTTLGGGIDRVTIDAGSRDGVTTDQSVVTSAGLLGRTVSVGPWTSDVLVVGAAEVVVGVRVGPQGVLATVGPTGSGGEVGSHPVMLRTVGAGPIEPGDAVVTLGSIDSRPFVPGLPVGTVDVVAPAQGSLGRTATVVPAVAVDRVDVVGVLVVSPRRAPRGALP